MQVVKRGWAVGFLALAVVGSACTAPRAVSNVTPIGASPSPSAEASPSPTPSPSSPLAIKKPPFHSGEVGFGYSPVTLLATGGVTPYSWSTTSLPGGLSLSPAGVVSGTPSSPGSFGFTVTVSDAGGGTAGAHASITVYQALAMTEPCAGKCVVGKGCSKCGTFGTVSRGLAPYSYKLVGGTIPKGMTWSGLALKGGFPAGSYAMSVQVTDKLGAHVQVDANWSIYNPASLLPGRSTVCSNNQNQPVSCTVTWSYSGGNPSVIPKVAITGYQPYCPPTGCYPSQSAPPPGWTVSVKGGVVTISANSTACVTAYDSYITFVLLDPSACATTLPSNTWQILVDLRYAC